MSNYNPIENYRRETQGTRQDTTENTRTGNNTTTGTDTTTDTSNDFIYGYDSNEATPSGKSNNQNEINTNKTDTQNSTENGTNNGTYSETVSGNIGVTTSQQMIEILRYSWRKEHIRNYFIETALATPGHPTRHGSLLGRMSSPKYKDRVFVKTGTMVTEGTSSLTGYIHAGDGHWYLFCIINNNAPVAESRIFQDLLCKTFIEHSL